MAKSFKRKMIDYLNNLEARGVIEIDESYDNYTLYNVADGYIMKYKTATIWDDPDEVEIYCVVIDHDDGQVEFKSDMDADVLIVGAADLHLLSKIHIAVDVPAIDEQDDVLVNDDYEKRLVAVEQQLATLDELLSKLDHQFANKSVKLEHQLAELNGALSKLEHRLEHNVTQINLIKAEIDELKPSRYSYVG